MLVFADAPCDCPELYSEGCDVCAAFAIKMGMFVNIYSKADAGENEDSGPKHETQCDCVYISNVQCVSCATLIHHIEVVRRHQLLLLLDPLL